MVNALNGLMYADHTIHHCKLDFKDMFRYDYNTKDPGDRNNIAMG